MDILGYGSGLGGALCFGLFSLLLRKKAARVNILILYAGALLLTAVVSAALLAALSGLGSYRLRLGQDLPWSVALLFASVLLALALGNTAYFFALRWLGVGKALPISLMEPLLATGLAVALLGESFTLGLGIAVLLIPIGVFLISAAGDGDDSLSANKRAKLGILAALGSAAAWSLGAVAMRPAMQQVDPITASVVRAGLGALVLWLLSWRSETWLGKEFSTRPGVWVTLIAGVVFCANILLFAFSIASLGAARATAVSATAPLFALPLAAYWLGEKVTKRTLVGTLPTVAGVAILVLL